MLLDNFREQGGHGIDIEQIVAFPTGVGVGTDHSADRTVPEPRHRLTRHHQMGGMGEDLFRPGLQTSFGGLQNRTAGADHIVADYHGFSFHHAGNLTDDSLVGIVAVLVGGSMGTIQQTGQSGDPFREPVIGRNQDIILQSASFDFINDQIVGPDMLGTHLTTVSMKHRLGVQIDKSDEIGPRSKYLPGSRNSLGNFVGIGFGTLHGRIAEKGNDDIDGRGIPVSPAGNEIKQFLDMYGAHGEGRVQQLTYVLDRTDAAIVELEQKRAHIDATLAELRVINAAVRNKLETK